MEPPSAELTPGHDRCRVWARRRGDAWSECVPSLGARRVRLFPRAQSNGPAWTIARWPTGYGCDRRRGVAKRRELPLAVRDRPRNQVTPIGLASATMRLVADLVSIEPQDVKQYLAADALFRAVGDRDPTPLWKSAPYLAHFMHGYKFNERLDQACTHSAHVVADVLARHGHSFLSPGTLESWSAFDPANAKLRDMVGNHLDHGLWRLLWLPPTLPYWPLEGPLRDHPPCRPGGPNGLGHVPSLLGLIRSRAWRRVGSEAMPGILTARAAAANAATTSLGKCRSSLLEQGWLDWRERCVVVPFSGQSLCGCLMNPTGSVRIPVQLDH